MITLKGMTWDHSRGYDPMIATSKVFAKKHNNNISIEWNKRSLQEFADRPIEQMTEEYDLMVIDYPHVGEVSAKGLLQNFDVEKYYSDVRTSPLSEDIEKFSKGSKSSKPTTFCEAVARMMTLVRCYHNQCSADSAYLKSQNLSLIHI